MLYSGTFVKTNRGTMPIETIDKHCRIKCYDGKYRIIKKIKRVSCNYIFDIILNNGGESIHLSDNSSILVSSPGGLSKLKINESTLSKSIKVLYVDSWDKLPHYVKINYQHNYLLLPEYFYSVELEDIDSNEINNMIEVKFDNSDKSIFVL